MENKRSLLDVLKGSAFELTFQAANTAICSYVARKINYFMDDQDQKKIQKAEKVPPPEKRRIGF